MSVQLPPRQSMIEVADYLDALIPTSGILGAVSLRAVSKILRERAPEAPVRATEVTVSTVTNAKDAAMAAVRSWEWKR